MTLTLRIAGYQDARSVHTRAMRVLETSLKRALGDGIAIDFQEDIAKSGRKVADLLDLVETGALDLCYFSSSYVTARVPALGAFDIPFLMQDRERTRALLQGALGERLAEAVAANTGYRVLGFWDNGPRHISNALRQIRMPDDCKGIRIRTLPSAGHHATYRALGMEPMTIDIRDFVEAIASGTVDAQENPLTNLRLFGLQKYHRHVTMTAHFQGIALLLCNAGMLAGLSAEVRQALQRAAAEATQAQWDFAQQDERESRIALEAEGVAVVELDATARAAFRAAVQPLAERQLAELPPDVRRLLPSL
jgi:TRAP-type C4-dicarboxylate transport system substrate-binding protein